MQDKVNILLHPNILGSNITVTEERAFKATPVGDLQEPAYRAGYFETIPTTWAVAYSARRAIERRDRQALEEWLMLFLLDYFGQIHLKSYEQTTLQQDYDRDLWPALYGTYPRPANDTLKSVRLLHASSNAETVVGGYYPGIFFFPSRGRSRWSQDAVLAPFLEQGEHGRTTLSWRRGVEFLSRDPRARQQFFLRLRSIAELLELEAKKALYDFITNEPLFKGLSTTGTLERLSPNPHDWPRPHVEAPPDPRDPDALRQREALLRTRLLDSYPLQKKRNGGTTYYLITDWPEPADWMTTGVEASLPAPNQYEKVSDKQLKVRHGAQEHFFKLGEADHVELLTEFLLDKAPYFCGMNKAASETQAGQIRRLHKQEIGNPAGDFKFLQADDTAICLAPLRGKLLEHFPELLHEPERCLALRVGNDSIHWKLTLLGREFNWPTLPKYKPLQEASLALWPPQVSEDWRLYVLMATGADKNTYGRWSLVDEQGVAGGVVEASKSEGDYLNILPNPEDPSHGNANRPRALLLRDTSDNERGVLLLNRLEEPTSVEKSADLAMDFGTSNSCLAYSVNNDEAKPLVFDEKSGPQMLWGEAPRLENPGAVPFRWGGTKGYFPTVLLSRRGASFNGVRADNLEAAHLFNVDIPGLHKEMETRVFDGTLGKQWAPHFDLKWESDAEHPWRRAAFLGLTLLYAYAELFFKHGAKIKRGVFTFPLAFGKSQREGFLSEAEQVVTRINQLCHGAQAASPNCKYQVSESEAIAQAVKSHSNEAVLEVFVDIGGGTTDIAIRHDGQYPVLDSIKLAGKSFFVFAGQNFNATREVTSSAEFRRHLGRLLFDQKDERTATETIQLSSRNNLDLGVIYSLAINRLDDKEFKAKEAAILEQGMGWPSYQRYRTELFFRHILAYALLQACAVAVDRKLTPEALSSGIKLILSGNGWGLLLFAEFERSKGKLKEEAQQILESLKQRLLRDYDEHTTDETLRRERACLAHLRVSDIDLLNEADLSEAKTKVPKGALKDLDKKGGAAPDDARIRSYVGVNLPRVRVNGHADVALRWCDLWGDAELRALVKQRLGFLERNLDSFQIGAPASYERPLDHALEVFTSLSSSGDHDPLPPEEWQKINSELCNGAAYLEGNRLTLAPINYFVSRILYPDNAEHLFLNRLAVINKTIK